MLTKAKIENGSGVPAVQSKGTAPADIQVSESENIKVAAPVAPIINSDAMNNALLAARNPREALIRIRHLTQDAKQMIRLGKITDASAALNQIATLTGALS